MNKNENSSNKRPIWAPWRIEYIRNEKLPGCFICDKAQNKLDDLTNLVVVKGEYSYVLMNEFPYNSGHLLVAPYQHTSDFCGLSTKVNNEISELTIKSVEVLKLALDPQGFNIGYNLGECAGAGLRDHLHQHIVPRWNGDTNFMPVITNNRVIPEALLDTCKILKELWQKTFLEI